MAKKKDIPEPSKELTCYGKRFGEWEILCGFICQHREKCRELYENSNTR